MVERFAFINLEVESNLTEFFFNSNTNYHVAVELDIK